MTIALLYGGRSTEHEVSLSSAAGVLRALAAIPDIEVELVAIDRDGRWYLQDRGAQLARAERGDPLQVNRADDRRVVVTPGEGFAVRGGRNLAVECVFPILHGSYGEDGTLQGLLEMADVAYVGSGVVGSAVGMDKLRAKQLWHERGLPVVPYLYVERAAAAGVEGVARIARSIDDSFGFPVFVKPNAAGSSVGISRVADAAGLATACDAAWAIDGTILIEKALTVREIETAVLGNDTPRAFPPGEVIPTHEFYDYDAKYEDPAGARLEIPATLGADTRDEVMRMSVEAYRAVDAAGLARVDCFVVSNPGDVEEIYLNEINTIPGFTPISMYPKMVEAGGMSYQDLLVELIRLAGERYHSRRALDRVR
ncbi:MAG: D-alanine--D-alanine ligase [Spirochaetales bacterium]|nr:D-alanine--D-alanine ligase [Spirochaetales bacterium]